MISKSLTPLSSLTACLETLETLSTLAQDVRGSSTCLQLSLGALETTSALIIGVLTTLTTGGGRGTLENHVAIMKY